MKIALVFLLLAASALAQNTPVAPSAACGPDNVKFNVIADGGGHPLAQPEAGKALIYFVHDAGSTWSLGYPTARVGLDGAWVGANHGNSYFSVSVSSGEHHVCVDLQSSLVAQRVELAHLTAEPGMVYFYRTRLMLSRAVEMLELDRIDSDQGKYLVSSFPLSISKLKK